MSLPQNDLPVNTSHPPLTIAERIFLEIFAIDCGIVVDVPIGQFEPIVDAGVPRDYFYILLGKKLIEKMNMPEEIVRMWKGPRCQRYYYRITAAGRAALGSEGASNG